MHSKSQVGDWLRISTPHPRRVWNDPDCYPTHVVSWCTSIITIEGGTAISRLASTQFSGLATPHPVGKLRGVIWLGVTGQQCFAWQTACYLTLPYGSCSHSSTLLISYSCKSTPLRSILTSHCRGYFAMRMRRPYYYISYELGPRVNITSCCFVTSNGAHLNMPSCYMRQWRRELQGTYQFMHAEAWI